jgi:hypothetical protein
VFFTTKALSVVRLIIELGRQPQDQQISLMAIA